MVRERPESEVIKRGQRAKPESEVRERPDSEIGERPESEVRDGGQKARPESEVREKGYRKAKMNRIKKRERF